MIKIAFCGFYKHFDPHILPISKMILDNYDCEICDLAQADYVLYSVFDEKHWFAPDTSIKIFYTGENITPDFNACDYAIGFDYISLGDRYIRYPLYYTYSNITDLMENKHQISINEIRGKKEQFCSITVSNDKRNPIFRILYEELSKYKQVDSGGQWMNNIGGRVEDKFAFDRSHKFSIVCENSASPGYTTEKLVQAFAANCIPIYWGDPDVGKVFNTKAFINVPDYASVGEVVEHVKKIDSDDTLYEEMLRQPALVDDCFCKENQVKQLKMFLDNIFLQPKELAMRRNRIFWGRKYIKMRQTQVKRSESCIYASYWKEKAKILLTTLKR